MGCILHVKRKLIVPNRINSFPVLFRRFTGLDSAAAYAVMISVRQLAKHISVICTIHQPPAEVANLFDYVLALKPGGRVVFFSPLKYLPSYFAHNKLGKPRKDKNIADFALEQVKKYDKTKKQGEDDDDAAHDENYQPDEDDYDFGDDKNRFLEDGENPSKYRRKDSVDLATLFNSSQLGKAMVKKIEKGL